MIRLHLLCHTYTRHIVCVTLCRQCHDILGTYYAIVPLGVNYIYILTAHTLYIPSFLNRSIWFVYSMTWYTYTLTHIHST